MAAFVDVGHVVECAATFVLHATVAKVGEQTQNTSHHAHNQKSAGAVATRSRSHITVLQEKTVACVKKMCLVFKTDALRGPNWDLPLAMALKYHHGS